jgi:Leucine-rich repeat (LRR) protein
MACCFHITIPFSKEAEMKKLIPLLLAITVCAYGQTVSVRGSVSTSNGPVKFASITFVDESDTTRRFSSLTDTSGNYQLDILTSIKPHDNLPTKFELEQNYPNPFSSSTSISYKLNEQSNISVEIYNILGQVVKEFKVGMQVAGIHGIVWDGTNNFGKKVTQGIYFCRLQTSERTASRKMVLLSNDNGNMVLHESSTLSPSIRKSMRKSLSSTQAKTYTVEVACVDSTEPRIADMETTGVVINRDTTVNFSVKRVPVARISGDQVLKVGQYTILDGSGSTQGDGDTLIYKWTADANNPGYVYIDASNPTQKLGFLIKGIYKFTLTVNNGYSYSSPETATVVVDSRTKIAFIDSCFEISLRESLGVPNADITDEMLLSIDTLYNYSSYYRITSLKGIEKCSNLTVLGISDQSVADVSQLSGLTKLRSLSLDQNYHIVDVSPLADLTNLKNLNIESNNISDISPLRNLTNLLDLGLLGNPVTDISSLSNMTELEQLWLGRYGYNTFPMSGTSVISKFTKLWLLWITDCDCRDLSFISTLDSLQYLRLSFCNVKDISPILNLTQLQRLYMDSDSITDIAPLSNLTNLNIIDLRFNQITNIEPLVANSGVGQGDAVSLTGNPLDSISINQYIPQLKSRGVAVFY